MCTEWILKKYFFLIKVAHLFFVRISRSMHNWKPENKEIFLVTFYYCLLKLQLFSIFKQNKQPFLNLIKNKFSDTETLLNKEGKFYGKKLKYPSLTKLLNF